MKRLLQGSTFSTFVCLDSDILKVAGGRQTRSGSVICALIAKKIKGLDDAQVSDVLKGVLATLPHPPGQVEFLLPRHFAIVRTLQFPSTDDAEIRQLAGFQAVKVTPYTSDEMVLDVSVLEKGPEFSTAHLVVVGRDVVDRILSIAKSAGVEAGGIRLSTEAYENAWKIASQKMTWGNAAPPSLGLLGMDWTRTQLVVLDNGKTRYSRSLPVGWETETGEGLEKMEKNWIQEIDLSLAAYRKENPVAPLPALALDANISQWKNWTAFLQSRDLAHPFFLDPLSLLPRDTTFSKDIEPGLEISWMDMIGALALPTQWTMDLLPQDVRQQKDLHSRRRKGMQIAALSGILVAMGIAYFFQTALSKKLYLSDLRRKLGTVQSTAASLESRSEKLDLLRSQRSTQGEVLEVIRQLYELFPDSVALTALSYERGKSVTVKGTAKDLSDVFALIPVLEKSPIFENVASQYASKRRVLDKEFTDFQIQCFLSGRPPAKPEKS